MNNHEPALGKNQLNCPTENKMLSRKILVCVVLLLPATALASLTLRAQENDRTANFRETHPATPLPPQPIRSPFDNSPRASSRPVGQNYVGQNYIGWKANALQKAFATLKAAETDQEKSNAKTELRDALVTDYDNKMDQYDGQIESLEKQLEQMKDRLSRRRAAKEEMVDLKLKEMLATADGLGWPGSSQQTSDWRPATSIGPRGFAPVQIQRPILQNTPARRPSQKTESVR